MVTDLLGRLVFTPERQYYCPGAVAERPYRSGRSADQDKIRLAAHLFLHPELFFTAGGIRYRSGAAGYQQPATHYSADR